MKNTINLTIELSEEQVKSLIREGSCLYHEDKITIQIGRLPIFEEDYRLIPCSQLYNTNRIGSHEN